MAEPKKPNDNQTPGGGGDQEVLAEIFGNLYHKDERTFLEDWIPNIKSDLENVPDVEGFVMSRIKGPLSILKKVRGRMFNSTKFTSSHWVSTYKVNVFISF